ncbi:hypothetical protein E4U42_001270 [Claviceps africana]|uniref:Sodium/calcium exchanger membrane region domain-containing protein n=1 Tax=Claviceps africana TaxID=83212 RepID=A0A8K0IZA5_9HYPO|nr:hypothetical protein E4U42_001270 [Claviceps africana]
MEMRLDPSALDARASLDLKPTESMASLSGQIETGPLKQLVAPVPFCPLFLRSTYIALVSPLLSLDQDREQQQQQQHALLARLLVPTTCSMKQPSSDPPDIHDKPPGAANQNASFPLRDLSSSIVNTAELPPAVALSSSDANHGGTPRGTPADAGVILDEKVHRNRAKPARLHLVSDASPPLVPVPVTLAQMDGQGPDIGQEGEDETNDNKNKNKNKKRTFLEELRRSFWLVATHSWINVLLVFVPIGIVVANVHGVHGGIVFAMNCIAVIPLAGLLSHATESVASKMGDSLGALLNVTFGNAVELIIFIIALVKNEIRIVQASLLGSILANLLLILGMGFFLGGLRYREQIYNSTVTQMSACLLSLSVISLVLPTAFHASFKDSARADVQSLKISRGTSVILLLVYIIYLMFQLKSHAYMYESTPQHIVDAESTPGPAAAWLDTSSSSDSDSSSSSDSDSSNQSRDTIGRKVKKVLRGGRRRKSSFSSTDNDAKSPQNDPRVPGPDHPSPPEEAKSEASSSLSGKKTGPAVPLTTPDVDTTDDDDEQGGRYRRYRRHRHRRRRKHKRARHDERKSDAQRAAESNHNDNRSQAGVLPSDPRRVDFAAFPVTIDANASAASAAAAAAAAAPSAGATAGEGGVEPGTPRRPLVSTFRSISVVKTLAPAVFTHKQNSLPPVPVTPTGPVPRVRYGIRRTNSLPDRLGYPQHVRPAGAMYPARVPHASLSTSAAAPNEVEDEQDEHLTRAAAVTLLLASTALVAVCAEFLVGSIKEVTASSGLGEVFIGLIILPIVGNAAEHVTAVTVAMKNKMDLAIGVAVGSSIQIALFVTPLVVILGWIMDKPMTLYFTLFETVCLFVSAFIVNFLVLDGRSNYLEGALLCAVYVIIAVVAFFFPDERDANPLGQ